MQRQPRATTPTKPIVLHFTEAFGGGIISAIVRYAELTNNHYDHVLIFRERAGHETGDALSNTFLQVIRCGPSTTMMIIEFIYAIQRIRPSIVHLHSTYAGAIGRILMFASSRVVYSPHCYSFERRDIGPASRAIALLGEHLLSYTRATTAAVGEYELKLTSSLKGRPAAVVIKNSVDLLDRNEKANIRDLDGPIVVAMVGRTMPQKGVDFFIQTKAQSAGNFQFIWIGGGHKGGQEALEKAGIKTTGWMRRNDLVTILSKEVDIYFHTAEWEGTPIAVLEAAAIGLPIVARRIPHLEDLGLPCEIDTPAQAAQTLVKLQSSAARRMLVIETGKILENFSSASTRESILSAYGQVEPVTASGVVLPA